MCETKRVRNEITPQAQLSGWGQQVVAALAAGGYGVKGQVSGVQSLTLNLFENSFGVRLLLGRVEINTMAVLFQSTMATQVSAFRDTMGVTGQRNLR